MHYHCKLDYLIIHDMYFFKCPLVLQFTSYFMELATPHTEEAIKFMDKVGGFEWLIQKYEMDGSSAIKLDLSLDTPIIIVPKNSQSEEYVYALFPVCKQFLGQFP